MSTEPSAPAVFDFTRRKKWQDILVTEVSGCMTVVLSLQGKVLFATRSVREILGYRETDIVDTNISEYLHENDVNTYMWQMSQTLSGGRQSDCVVRFRERLQQSPSQTYKSMELTAVPYAPEPHQQFSCVIVTARPFPTRYMEVCQSLIELKLENERLQRSLAEQADYMHEPTSSAAQQTTWKAPGQQLSRYQQPGMPFMQTSQSLPNILNFDSMMPLDFSSMHGIPPPLPPSQAMHKADSPLVQVALSSNMDVDHYEQPKKKKQRTLKQLVCADCGRTDSPEWRKGPRGPKTLCNACGLRFSKKKSEAAAAGTASTSGLP
ncbi:GATA-domain-containing protein [Auricularia subglabra TFB-10046 SS5]|nr:GATA-domain-containing protein [Auricularia subglabra TFB-10046 SS5]